MSVAYSSEISHDQLSCLDAAVPLYVARYRNVLGGKNTYYLSLAMAVVKGLKRTLEPSKHSSKLSTAPNSTSCADASADLSDIVRTNDFIFEAGLDNINLLKVRRHMDATHLARKVGGFADGLQDSGFPSGFCCSALRCLQALLGSLVSSDEDGRIRRTRQATVPALAPSSSASVVSDSSGVIRFISLNPAAHFAKVVSEARSVILLGGTLQPFEHITSALFPSVPSARLVQFSCDHIAPASHVLALALSNGPSGAPFDFRHASKQSEALVKDLLRCFIRVAAVCPNGMVVFFTSYAYLEQVREHFDKLASEYAELQSIKKVFIEPRDAKDMEKVWAAYSASALSAKGAILFSVVGGKLSEGINFSDALARCVAVVGMPYPNAKDPLLQEKMKYAEKFQPGGGRAFYTALCMRAVNQSIGRAIRHRNDYATVLLIDCRYSNDNIVAELPGWIRRSMSCCSNFDMVEQTLETFYSGHDS